MSFCPKCGAEYRPEITRCADCDASLSDTREVIHARDEDWVSVFSGDAGAVAAARGALEAAGIETLAPDEFMSSFAPFYTTAGFYSQVYVPASVADQARKILQVP